MNRKLVLFFLAILVFVPATPEARSLRHTNKLREKAKQAVFNAELEKIPVYREKLGGEYQILGFVHGEDAFTRKKTAIIQHMRLQAHKMGASAIMEFKCRRIWKSFLQSCEGFAIKSEEPGATLDSLIEAE